MIFQNLDFWLSGHGFEQSALDAKLNKNGTFSNQANGYCCGFTGNANGSAAADGVGFAPARALVEVTGDCGRCAATGS